MVHTPHIRYGYLYPSSIRSIRLLFACHSSFEIEPRSTHEAAEEEAAWFLVVSVSKGKWIRQLRAPAAVSIEVGAIHTYAYTLS